MSQSFNCNNGNDNKDPQTTLSKWDQRYQQSTSPGTPCRVLAENLHLLPQRGKALDLACGLGANALCLATQGRDVQDLEVHAWDSSAVALEKLAGFAATQNLTVHTLQRDVETSPPEAGSFDIIVVSQFLYRPIMPTLTAALRPGGLLFYQTFHQNKLATKGPSSPDYLLTRNELLCSFRDLLTVYYREDHQAGDLQQGLRDCSYYIGQQPE